MFRKTTIALVAGLLFGAVALLGMAGAGQDEVTGSAWRPCAEAPASYPARCATFAVPVDWNNPAAGTLNLRVARLPAARQDQRIGTLMFNPGGPGGPAASIVADPDAVRAYFPREIRDRFDIVGVDPRGVGGSQALRCGARPHQPEVSRFPRDAGAAAELAVRNARFAASCERDSGSLVTNVDTESVARDLDAVRARLGEERISFVGISYGTMLAQSYAELFPDRLRSLVLDGPVDRSRSWWQLSRDGAAATQDGVRRFSSWCARDSSCALHRAGVLGTVERVLTAADAGRLSANSRKVNAEEVALAVQGALNSGDSHPELARLLRAAARGGDATTLLNWAPFRLPEMYTAHRTIVCQDVPVPPSAIAELPDEAEHLAELGPTLRGASEFWNIASGCAGWPAPAKWRPHPWSVPADFPATVVLSGAHDVATPRAWAESVHRQLPRSELVRWEGDGHTAWLNDPRARRAAIDHLIAGSHR
ncbi:MAG: alpha/beta fold hydrolase [Pseudonocardiaceae bacterium]|nr:alpha/beta fold hydrolase [Pseudonocardiaceae bacterium]